MRVGTMHAIAVGVSVICLGVAAAVTEAASIDALGPQGEAVEDTPWVFAASGQAERDLGFFATIKPVGGRPCAPSVAADDGTSIVFAQSVSGAWTVTEPTSASHTPNPGDYMVCAWLQETSSDPAVAAASAVVRARQPTATLTVTPTTAAARPGSPVTFRFQGASELERQVYAKIRPASGTAPCAAGFGADNGENLLFFETVHGAFDFTTASSSLTKAGTYRVCAWLAENSADLQSEATAQVTVTVRSCGQARRRHASTKRALASARRGLSRAQRATRRARGQRARARARIRTRRAQRAVRAAKRAVSRTRADVRASCGTA
jgi:hypothetical protein